MTNPIPLRYPAAVADFFVVAAIVPAQEYEALDLDLPATTTGQGGSATNGSSATVKISIVSASRAGRRGAICSM